MKTTYRIYKKHFFTLFYLLL